MTRKINGIIRHPRAPDWSIESHVGSSGDEEKDQSERRAPERAPDWPIKKHVIFLRNQSARHCSDHKFTIACETLPFLDFLYLDLNVV